MDALPHAPGVGQFHQHPHLHRRVRNPTNLCTLAYNDSVVIYNGKQLVSPTGGTWYRSRMMLHDLSETFRFTRMDRDSLIWNTALKKRVEIILKTNPGNKIYHTTQVERNGFIHSMLSGTRHENKGYTLAILPIPLLLQIR